MNTWDKMIRVQWKFITVQQNASNIFSQKKGKMLYSYIHARKCQKGPSDTQCFDKFISANHLHLDGMVRDLTRHFPNEKRWLHLAVCVWDRWRNCSEGFSLGVHWLQFSPKPPAPRANSIFSFLFPWQISS